MAEKRSQRTRATVVALVVAMGVALLSACTPDTGVGGIITANGTGRSGIVVELFQAGTTNRVGATTTANDGSYELDHVKPGDYDVRLGGIAWFNGTPTAGPVATPVPVALNDDQPRERGRRHRDRPHRRGGDHQRWRVGRRGHRRRRRAGHGSHRRHREHRRAGRLRHRRHPPGHLRRPVHEREHRPPLVRERQRRRRRHPGRPAPGRRVAETSTSSCPPSARSPAR